MAAQGSDFADAPDYAGNAALVESTMPPTPRHDRLAVTRSYHPKYLPHYVDDKDDEGNVLRSAASMYAAAIPKVSRAVGAALSPDLKCDYAMNFVVATLTSFLYGHKFNYYSEYQYGDLDPYTDPYQNPDNKDPPKDDPLKPIWNDPCNKDCPEAMYIVPVLHYTWTDEDGNKHQSTSPINPRNGEPEYGGSDAVGKGKIHNNCLGLYKNVDNSAGWAKIVATVGDGSCGDEAYAGRGCGARSDLRQSHSPCMAKCITEGRAQKFNGTKGPKFNDVEKSIGRCNQVIYRPTSVRYDLCWQVDQAKEACIESDSETGIYGGLWYDFCSCHAYLVRQTHKMGREYNLNPNEEHELCIPYNIPISYGANGCPYIEPGKSGPAGPTQGQNNGDWDSGDPDTYIDFELWPKSQIPSHWFDDDDSYSQNVGYEIEAYAAFSRSALHRHRTGERT